MSGNGTLIQSQTVRQHEGNALTINLPAAPGAGRLVIGALGVDKAPGVMGAPAGFTLRDSYAGLSVGTALADAAAGQGGDWTWSDPVGLGAVAALAEFDIVGAALTSAARFPNPATDTSITTITGTLGNAPSTGTVFAAISTDTSYDNSGTWPTASTITHTGWTRVLGPLQKLSSTDGLTAGGCALILLRRDVTAGESTDLTMSWTGGGADQCGLVMAHYAWTSGSGTPTRTLDQAWLGVDAIAVKTTSSVAGETVRVAFSTASNMASPVYSTGGLQTPTADGMTRHTIPALAGATAHWYQVELGGVLIGTAQPFTTLPTAGVQSSFAFGFASCRHHSSDLPSTNPSALADAITRGIGLFLEIGDLHYRDITTDTPSSFKAGYDELFTRGNIAALLRSVPTGYVWDDHDYGGNNSDSTTASRPAAQSVYRERVPSAPLPSATGIYHTFRIGRVRFVMLDSRSFRSPVGNVDDSSKTMLGAEQKTWLQGILAASDSPLTVIVSPVPWIGISSTGADHWGLYQTERTQIGGYITAAATRCIILAGDAHMLAYDSGVNSVAGVPVYHAAALNGTTTIKGGPYSGGSRGSTDAYGRVVVTDTGSQIDFAYSGYYDGGTLWASHTTTIVPGGTNPSGAFFPFFP
jgi:phosphodiesterase/alkaline phosphatase D-like protein